MSDEAFDPAWLVPLLRRIAARMVTDRTLIDDLVQEGQIGFLEAARRFDPSRGIKLTTYAMPRARGAMQDYLREADPLSRRQRQLARQGIDCGPQIVPLATYAEETFGQADRELAAIDNRDEIDELLRGMKGRDRQILELYYLADCTMAEIAAAIGITESYVSMLHGQALARLRERIENRRKRQEP